MAGLLVGKLLLVYLALHGRIVGLVSTFWFAIGGTIDLRRLFRDLAKKEVDILDDGRVTDAAPGSSQTGPDNGHA